MLAIEVDKLIKTDEKLDPRTLVRVAEGYLKKR